MYDLINAVKEKNLDLVKRLLETGIDMNIQDRERKTALLYAAKNNNESMVKYLEIHRANTSNQNFEKTPKKFNKDLVDFQSVPKMKHTSLTRESDEKLHSCIQFTK